MSCSRTQHFDSGESQTSNPCITPVYHSTKESLQIGASFHAFVFWENKLNEIPALSITALSNEVLEFSDVCRHYLGRWAEVVAFISSLLTLLGGMIVYWILISNFLYNIVAFIYRKFLVSTFIFKNKIF